MADDSVFPAAILLKISTIQMGRGAISDSESGLKDMVYPNNFGFFLAIAVTIPVLLLLFACAKRKPGASRLVYKIRHGGMTLLVVTAVLIVVIIFVPFVPDLTGNNFRSGYLQTGVSRDKPGMVPE